MKTQRETIRDAIAGLEAKRSVLGDSVADSALDALRERLAELEGSPAPATVADEQSLRQVTVLFTDVVGSTRLSQRLEPEDIQAVIDGALARFRDVVESHGGRALQYAGDSMLAAFGIEAADENDPERAILAGLGILEQARLHSDVVRARHADLMFEVRVGIHTGAVLLGGGVDGERTIRGMTVNIAARMEQAAPAGGLRITHATYTHVRGVFDVTEEAPLLVKGHDAPIRSYLVHRAKPRAFRNATLGVEGVETQMIGREIELELLQAAFKVLFSERKPAFVAVVADAGVGKSRLLYEFQNWAELRPERYLFFQGRAFAKSQVQPYALLRDVFAWRLQIGEGEAIASARAKLEQEIVPLFVGSDGKEMALSHAHLLGHLIGLDFSESPHLRGILEDGRQIRNRGFHAAAQTLRRLALRDDLPIVLLLEDLQWADEGSLEFLTYLRQVLRDMPLLVLGSTRPTLFERKPDWPRAMDAHCIELLPLDKGISRLLAGELLKSLGEVPSALRELISSSAEGNPFYMEELIKMLIDEGAIDVSGQPWKFVPERLLSLHVPPTLAGVLQARLDRLPLAEKRALQQGSVVGVVFWEKALVAIDPAAPAALPAILERALVRSRPEVDAEQGREFAFAHQILHRVTYDTLLKRTRRLYHASTAAWLASLSGAWAKTLLGTVAEHHEKAGDVDQACEYFARAAEDAFARHATEAVLTYTSRGLDLLGERVGATIDELRWRLHVSREKTLSMRGEIPEQLMSLEALRQIAESADDDARRGYVFYRWSDYAMRLGDYAAAKDHSREAMRCAEAVGDLNLKLKALTRLAASLHYSGDSTAADSLVRDALAQARAAGLRHAEGLCLNIVSVVSLQLDPFEAMRAEQQRMEICRSLGDEEGLSTSLNNAGASLMLLGDLAQAEHRLNEALKRARSRGTRSTESYALLNLAQVAWRKEDELTALMHARAALDIAVAASDPLKQSGALFWLGNAELALGDRATARVSFLEAYELGLRIQHTQRFDAACGLARVALEEGDVAEALARIEPVLSHLASDGLLNGCDAPDVIRLVCTKVLQEAADARAHNFVFAAYAELMSRAKRISDATYRDNFLAIAQHRALVAAWEAMQLQERSLRRGSSDGGPISAPSRRGSAGGP